ncbi:MAG: xanthine dehydrogenase family protein molybdopterin-binding subunit, partial [Betaproteobacteria bacterium]
DFRSLMVLNLAARKAGWKKKAPENISRGIAFFASPRWKCRLALVAEIEKRGNDYVPSRMVCAADIGLAVNPAIVRDQLEGAIVFGLTATLYGEITVSDGAVQQSNFHDYPMLRMMQTPKIETYLTEGDSQPGSVGEIGVPAVAPALANAFFAATGERIRQLPLRQISA